MAMRSNPESEMFGDPKSSTSETATPSSNRPQVNIADQIAIRSFVLGQSLGKVSGKSE